MKPRALTTVALILSTCCAASFAGVLHPAGDSLAAFRPYLGATLLAVAIVAASATRWGVASASLLIASVTLVAPIKAALPEETVRDGALTVYQKNAWRSRVDVEALAADIRSSNADVVTLQEVLPDDQAILQHLAADYPEQIVCRYSEFGDVAVLSRLDVLDAWCADREGVAGLRINAPNGPLWVISLHLRWPWPMDQADHLDAIIDEHLKPLSPPLVIGTDLNNVPWSQSAKRLQDATLTRRPGPVRPTYRIAAILGLAIDHVFTPIGWQAETERRPMFGSDHNGLVVKLTPPLP